MLVNFVIQIAVIKWKTQNRGIVFAIENKDYLTVASTKNDCMDFQNIQISKAPLAYIVIEMNE